MNTNTTVLEHDSQLAGYKTIQLADLKGLELMNRQDQKFLFHREKLPELLIDLSNDFYLLDVNGYRAQSYETIYYDTPQRQLYHDHLRGLRPRQKVRVRTYHSTGKQFLEVKTKNNRNKTQKRRVAYQESDWTKDEVRDFLLSFTPFEQKDLESTLKNTFNRITLVDLGQGERITIDFNLHFSDLADQVQWSNSDLCVSEVKAAKITAHSKIYTALKAHSIYESRFSKYAIGSALLNPDLRQNRFKATFLQMKKYHIL